MGRFKRWEWGKQIKESQPAYAWGRFITPLYGIKVVGFLAGVTYSVRALHDVIPLLTSRKLISSCCCKNICISDYLHATHIPPARRMARRMAHHL